MKMPVYHKGWNGELLPAYERGVNGQILKRKDPDDPEGKAVIPVQQTRTEYVGLLPKNMKFWVPDFDAKRRALGLHSGPDATRLTITRAGGDGNFTEDDVLN